MNRYFYRSTISSFIRQDPAFILGELSKENTFSLEQTQRNAWLIQIQILKAALSDYDGTVIFEYSIPRMGKRVDVVLLIQQVVFILEFKVGESNFEQQAVEQVWDYALDIKNFHEPSHQIFLAPILIATESLKSSLLINFSASDDQVLIPIMIGCSMLPVAIEKILFFAKGGNIDTESWIVGRYSPTPTIIEAAKALYNQHSVAEISRSDASAVNLARTSDAILKIIESAKASHRKAICLVSGVPGAGKTLVGLNVATQSMQSSGETPAVFLSGNGPLVSVLREALTRDKIARERVQGRRLTKGSVMREVKLFIQNVHHFRDDCLIDIDQPPVDHVAIFDEAQRAWNKVQTAKFMREKKNKPDFLFSEPEFLISCLDRHPDWAVVVCLIGGGQEINTGEAGLEEWIDSIDRSFKSWDIHVSDALTESEIGTNALHILRHRQNVHFNKHLHLSVSMRSFRAEHLSALVGALLDLQVEQALNYFIQIRNSYPIRLTRKIEQAKAWLKIKARGSERYGIVVSSQAQRLKPHAIDVKSPVDPIHWFLNDKNDVRSSYYLEDVATEFHVQGLELDWACVVWDADFRHSAEGWTTFSFVGDKWQRILKHDRQRYLKNAYRVLMTRARQGMVIVIPEGDAADHTRQPEYYDSTFRYFQSMGFETL